jgi:hypothetical protein
MFFTPAPEKNIQVWFKTPAVLRLEKESHWIRKYVSQSRPRCTGRKKDTVSLPENRNLEV